MCGIMKYRNSKSFCGVKTSRQIMMNSRSLVLCVCVFVCGRNSKSFC